MNLFVSRDGQTFGPYTLEQANQYLQAGQLLPNDYALFEGQTQWKSLQELLLSESGAGHGSITETTSVEASVAPSPEENQSSPQTLSKPKAFKSSGKKVQKVKGGAKVQTVYVAQRKSFISKVFSTILVFSFMMLLAIGGIVGAFFAMPETMGPLLKKFGLPIDDLIASSAPSENSQSEQKIKSGDPKSPDEISIDEEAFQTLRQSGIRILPMENAKGLQIIAPADPPLEDKDLLTLIPISDHVVSLDLTNSKITDQGMATVIKLPNLRKLNMEGATEITITGASQLNSLTKLEHLNLINVKLDDSIVDALLGMESLREVYLFKSGISEEAIKRLKDGRPKMFVNAG